MRLTVIEALSIVLNNSHDICRLLCILALLTVYNLA